MKKPRHLSKYDRMRAELTRLQNQRRQDAMCDLANWYAGDEHLVEMTYRSAMRELARLAGENLAVRVEKKVQANMNHIKLADRIRSDAINMALMRVQPTTTPLDEEQIFCTIDFGHIPPAHVFIRLPKLGKKD